MPGPIKNPASKKDQDRQTERTAHDNLNRGIITMLQEDGRTPYSTIAAKLGVSEGAVRKRVNQLQQSGAMKVVAVVNPLELNFDAYTMLGIKVAPPAQPEEVANRLAENPDVVYAIWVSGPYDLLVEVVFEERESFVQFLSDEIYGHDDVQNCDIMQNLKVVKNQYQLKPVFKVQTNRKK